MPKKSTTPTAPAPTPTDDLAPVERAARPPLLNPQQVAVQLGVTDRFVYEELRKGRLRSARIGRLHRIRQDDLDAYVEARLG
ncbi:excisionase family DNA-binding protein [Agromyces larvae]|uniref:Helix-turn-helix domain-containing protein n=1 Tax=Agromyces larvae TaxID=2929802 RepID=A0ABY4C9D8_9MICO|nr:helix-turn-helix domain-containing protein [Agromyces larvae]UOE45280.1 helix-turn-helix domain-containing protein [Agromyces larvae]